MTTRPTDEEGVETTALITDLERFRRTFPGDRKDHIIDRALAEIARLTGRLNAEQTPVPPDRERLATALLRYAADMEEPEIVQDLHAAAAALRTPPAEETT